MQYRYDASMQHGCYKSVIKIYCVSHSATNQWHAIEPISSDRPTPRDRTSGVAYRDAIYIFGGCGSSKLNDLWCFQTAVETWTPISRTVGMPSPR